nr:vegetative cell wall protein gp1-like [Lolium perenne]
MNYMVPSSLCSSIGDIGFVELLGKAAVYELRSNPYSPFQPVEVGVGEAKLAQPLLLSFRPVAKRGREVSAPRPARRPHRRRPPPPSRSHPPSPAPSPAPRSVPSPPLGRPAPWTRLPPPSRPPPLVAGPVAARSASIPPGPNLAVHLRFLRPGALARLRDARAPPRPEGRIPPGPALAVHIHFLRPHTRAGRRVRIRRTRALTR